MGRRIRVLHKSGQMMSLQEIEDSAIKYAVGRYGGNMVNCASVLGIGRSTLYRKITEINDRYSKGFTRVRIDR